MAKNEYMQFRYYELPQNEDVLALLGEEWIRAYGAGIDTLHFHNYTEIGICHDGKGQIVLRDHIYAYSPGSMVIIPANIPHNTISENEELSYWEWMYFDIPQSMEYLHQQSSKKIDAESLSRFLDGEVIFFQREEYPRLAAVLLDIRDECEKKQLFYVEKIHALLIELIVEWMRIGEATSGSQAVKQNIMPILPAIEYVEKRYAEDIRISRLASVCGISESHFRRLFQEYMNMAPLEYVNVVRIKMACLLMKKTDASMEEIAYQTGYGDVSTFNRNFKKQKNSTPYQWKLAAHENTGKIKKIKISAMKGW